MDRLIVVLIFLVPAFSAAQSADPLIFRERVHDFGEISESGGNADHEFIFNNNSGRPVKIMNVTASCGCTTPGWTKEPVAPGKTGFVKASFDPRGRPGFFNKSLTIITDLDANPIILQIKGTVGRPSDDDAGLMAGSGNLRLKSNSFSMGTVYMNKEAVTKQFPVKNSGDATIRFISAEKPAYIQVTTPQFLEPGQKGAITIRYDARARNTFGFVSDNITFLTSDSLVGSKSFTVYATLEEFYAPPTAEQLVTAPQAFLKESSLDLGQYPPGASLERKVTLYNKGKKELKIKALLGNCTCITAETDKRSVRAGDSTQIRILFKPQARGGTQQKAITLYTNDPRNPVQLVSVSVYVND